MGKASLAVTGEELRFHGFQRIQFVDHGEFAPLSGAGDRRGAVGVGGECMQLILAQGLRPMSASVPKRPQVRRDPR